MVMNSATADGSDFEGADMTLANVELAQVSKHLNIHAWFCLTEPDNTVNLAPLPLSKNRATSAYAHAARYR
jgi:hypothetical protein